MKKILSFILSAFILTANMTAPAFADTVNIAPSNLMALARDGVLNISWRNPARDDISEIKVYNSDGTVLAAIDADGATYDTETTNSATLVNTANTTLSLANGGRNYIDVKGLARGSKYKYQIAFTYANGEKFIGECISNTVKDYWGSGLLGGSKGAVQIAGWEEGVAGNAPHIKIGLSTDEYKSGSASLMITSNSPETYANHYHNFGPYLANSVQPKAGLTAGKTYRFSYYQKGVNAGNYWLYYNGTHGGKTPGTCDWTLVTQDITADAANNIFFRFFGGTDTLYIDDVSLKLLEDGVETGDNLLMNSGFEDATNLTTVEAENTAAKSEKGKTTVSWDALNTSKAAYVMICKKYGNYWNSVKVADASETSVTFDSDGTGEYMIKTVNAIGLESDGVTVSVEVEPVEFLDAVYTIDGADAETLAAGEVTLTRTVLNNAMGDDFDVMMVVGLFEGDLLKAYETDYKPIDQSGSISDDNTLSVNITVPSVSENTKLKVFMWKAPDDFSSLTDAVTIQ